MRLSYGSFVTVKSNQNNGKGRSTNLNRVEMLTNKKKQNLKTQLYTQNSFKALRQGQNKEQSDSSENNLRQEQNKVQNKGENKLPKYINTNHRKKHKQITEKH